MNFHDWINIKFSEWRGESSGRKGSITEYARWLGIPYKSLHQYINKPWTAPKSKQIIDQLVKKYNQEVYDILNIPPPLEFLQKMESIYYELEDNKTRQRQFMRRVSEVLSEFLPDRE